MRKFLWYLRLLRHGRELYLASLDADRAMSQLVEHGGMTYLIPTLTRLNTAIRSIERRGGFPL